MIQVIIFKGKIRPRSSKQDEKVNTQNTPLCNILDPLDNKLPECMDFSMAFPQNPPKKT
jgi:hypothetical protein